MRKAASVCLLLLSALAASAVAQPVDPAADLLRFHPELAPALAALRFLSKPLIFLGILLFIGLVIGRLLDRAIAPAAAHPEAGFARDERTTRCVMVGRVVVWTTALAAASEVVGWRWFGAVVAPFGRLFATIVTAAAVVFGVAVFALGFAGRSRDTLLSVLGWYYLTRHSNRPNRETPIDLGDGVTGRISKVDLLHTTFDVGSGKVEIRPNAWLMETHFGWGRAPGDRRPSEPDPSS